MRATALTTRRLPPDEWPKLAGTLLESVWTSLHPTDDVVVVVESDGVIVGCTSFLRVWHMDGAWIREADRGRASVARALRDAMRHTTQLLGANEVWMMATNDESRRLCEHVGAQATHLACDHFAVQFGAN